MAKNRRLDATTCERILNLADEGAKPTGIGQALGVNPSTVYGVLARSGFYAPVQRDDILIIMRAGRPVRRWIRTEDAFIASLRVEGLRISQITVRFEERFGYRRNPHCIGIRLKMLAALEDNGIGEAA